MLMLIPILTILAVIVLAAAADWLVSWISPR
jgi:hypothetical protein